MKQSQISNFRLAALSLLFCLTFSAATFARQQPARPVNLNTASAEELQKLPGIGPKLAARIIEHRQKHGPFKRPQDLIIVRGLSAKRFRPIAHLVVTGDHEKSR
ncbi:MAG TPA: helix-hairpin-helix domain-containing protein [Blastocatellia bacterium]|nr:helix-hairpin-helix domain-containing protein [Blastocatellia bacterium]HMV84780.1 helix-hairpin-helix domain-containing protein [Blastocatellia bacterium]HMX25625.1 helix-hairpin-helix domain-containing protein [Blastocatellia bacterium]HMY72757.1 helix-hairpin-helix domain-containing protein [Blastocatellia bacterium]HMZ19316.1 helix-hairpin-helix domain-containing protein [Blastocatellia bacterium]